MKTEIIIDHETQKVKFILDLRNNAHLMEYKRCIAGRIAPLSDNGRPIGNGPVFVPPAQQEDACKNIVKHRGGALLPLADVPQRNALEHPRRPNDFDPP